MQKELRITREEVATALGFINDLAAETDRAAVILTASKMEIMLGQILQKALLPCATSKDDLLEGEGRPLSTFSARIDLTHRLGLIDGICARALHQIRRIRNEFAHELSEGSLNIGAHRDRVKSLVAPFENSAALIGLKEAYLKGREATPRDTFRIIATILPVYLNLIHNSLITIAPLDIPLSLFDVSTEDEGNPPTKQSPPGS